MKALSIRQPWAWAILHAGKDIENRTWSTKYRGPLIIHASKFFDKEALIWMEHRPQLLAPAFSGPLPKEKDFPLGGITGTVILTDCVGKSDSPWFFGPFGLQLKDPRPLPFVWYPGRLGFFDIPNEFIQTH